MQRGKLKHIAVIEMPIKTADGMGGSTIKWGVVARRMASIWKRKSDEIFSEGKVLHNATWDIRIDYIKNLKTSYRINIDETKFNILSSMPVDFGKRYIDLVCEVAE